MARKVESYNDMFSRLQEVVNKLESNELSLEESMKVYEEGVKLVNKLYKTLNNFEGKIKIIDDDREIDIKGV